MKRLMKVSLSIAIVTALSLSNSAFGDAINRAFVVCVPEGASKQGMDQSMANAGAIFNFSFAGKERCYLYADNKGQGSPAVQMLRMPSGSIRNPDGSLNANANPPGYQVSFMPLQPSYRRATVAYLMYTDRTDPVVKLMQNIPFGYEAPVTGMLTNFKIKDNSGNTVDAVQHFSGNNSLMQASDFVNRVK